MAYRWDGLTRGMDWEQRVVVLQATVARAQERGDCFEIKKSRNQGIKKSSVV